MALAEFLAWEEVQELRGEFDGVGPVAMTGATAAHALMRQNLAIAIGARLRGTPCRMYGSDLKVRVDGAIRYPDAFITSGPVAANATLATDPVIVFEVLSPSTAAIDRIVKNREYAATPGIRRYVMPEQERIAATVFHRQGGDWICHLLGPVDARDLPEAGIALPLAELYEGVELFPDRPVPEQSVRAIG